MRKLMVIAVLAAGFTFSGSAYAGSAIPAGMSGGPCEGTEYTQQASGFARAFLLRNHRIVRVRGRLVEAVAAGPCEAVTTARVTLRARYGTGVFVGRNIYPNPAPPPWFDVRRSFPKLRNGDCLTIRTIIKVTLVDSDDNQYLADIARSRVARFCA